MSDEDDQDKNDWRLGFKGNCNRLTHFTWKMADKNGACLHNVYSVTRASNTDHFWQYRYFGILKNQYRYTGIDTSIIMDVI